jgi:hypothetical protein
MSEHTWPSGARTPALEDIHRDWPATVAALPIGAPVIGDVIARPPFGVFVRIEGVPGALGLAEVTAMPRGMDLPDLGAAITGRVLWHADHNHQVKLVLDE